MFNQSFHKQACLKHWNTQTMFSHSGLETTVMEGTISGRQGRSQSAQRWHKRHQRCPYYENAWSRKAGEEPRMHHAGCDENDLQQWTSHTVMMFQVAVLLPAINASTVLLCFSNCFLLIHLFHCLATGTIWLAFISLHLLPHTFRIIRGASCTLSLLLQKSIYVAIWVS